MLFEITPLSVMLMIGLFVIVSAIFIIFVRRELK